MYDPNADAPPFNPISPVVILVALLIGAVELVFVLGEVGILGGSAGGTWRANIAQQFGFSNRAAIWMWETGQFPPKEVARFVTYVFVHANLVATMFSIVFVLALGKFVTERINVVAFLVVFFGTGILTALIQVPIREENAVMLGGGAASYGLIGALVWVLFCEQRAAGLTGVRAFSLIFMLGILHLVFWQLFGGNDWMERAIGFAVGFGLAAMMQPKIGYGFGFWVAFFRRR